MNFDVLKIIEADTDWTFIVLENATKKLQNKDRVKLDLSTGEIIKL